MHKAPHIAATLPNPQNTATNNYGSLLIMRCWKLVDTKGVLRCVDPVSKPSYQSFTHLVKNTWYFFPNVCQYYQNCLKMKTKALLRLQRNAFNRAKNSWVKVSKTA